MRQNKVSILSTRPLNDELISEAAAKGVFIEVIPFIKTQPMQSVEVQKEIENAFLQSTAVAFTSSNAVETVASKLKGHQPDWQIFCIGYATRQLIEEYLGKDLISGITENAAELANLINKNNVDNVIFFCGDQRRDELPDLLRKNNIHVNEIIVYQTVATPSEVKKKYDGILFFSPSGVKSFFQKNQLDDQTVLFAIGNTTANEIKKNLPAGKAGSKNKILTSDDPGTKHLVEKAIKFFETNPIHH